MSRTHIPHLLTHLLTEHDLDALETAMLDKAEATIGTDASTIWCDAVQMIRDHRSASFHRRSKQTPSARRKSLGYRPALQA